MLKSNSISFAASLALVGSLTLVGCGSSTSSDVVNTGNGDTTQTVQAMQTGSISGTVKLINNPIDRTVRSTDAKAQIVAYNLDDNTEYTTTSTSQGEYDLSGLTEGHYQIIATSTSTTMRSIRQTTVKRNTRQVVDIVLQATGTIKGTIAHYSDYYYGEANLVSIPGTSYISTIDSKGNFELINVPAGDVTISLNGYYMQNVTVVGGEESIVENFGELVGNKDIYYVSNLYTDSTLEMRHEGIRVETRHSYTLSDFEKLVSLENNASNAVDIQVSNANDWDDDGAYASSFVIATTSVVDAGTYTLKIATSDPYTKEIELKDKVAVFSDAYTNNGVYHKNLGIAFSNPVSDINTSAITVSYLDDANTSKTLALTGIEQDKDRENEYRLLGNFVNGVEYQVTLDSALQEDGLFYVANEGLSWSEDGVTLEETRVNYLSIDDNEENVALSKQIRFTVYDSDALDLQTLKVVLGDKELTLKNGGLKSYNNNSYYSNYLDIVVDNSSLTYSKDFNMTITANDSYGDKTLEKTVSFTTITPETVGVLPYEEVNDDNEWFLDTLRNSIHNDPYNDSYNDSYNEGFLLAYFNVPVANDSGSITLHDNTNNKDITVYTSTTSTANQPYSNNTETPYRIGGTPAELLPNTEYTMTVAGFTTPDGTKIATKTNTFKTPSRTLLDHSVNNGQLRNASNMQNRLEFTTFGKLSDAEKADFVNGLDITSFNTGMTEDKTHPKPLALWDETLYGSKLILAFTIEAGKSYELKFSGTVAKELEMTASPLTFMTMSDETPTGNFTPEYNIVNSLYTYNYSEDYNLSIVNDKVDGYAQVTIPYIVDDNYNSTSSQKCNNLRYKNIYNDSGYEDTPDVNSSVISTWMSGDELNVTSTSLSGMNYNSHYSYDENGQYIGYYYTCDVSYNAYFSMSNDANSSVTLNVPESALEGELVADNFIANDTNRTVMAPASQEAYTNVSVYSNGFDIYFSKPVLVTDLDTLGFTTNPDLNVKVNAPYAPYYDADGNKYTKEVSGSFDSSAYSAFGYDVNTTLTYFDRVTQTQNDLNLTDSGVVYTSADLTPLEVSKVSLQDNSIYMYVNRAVDLDTVLTKDDNGTVVSSAFVLSNENNDSNVTASISNAINNYNYSTGSSSLVLDVTRSDSDGDCYDAETFTLTQSEAIKADGSTQTLDAGSVTATIVLPEEKSGCDTE